jgi:hypothetical protein
MNFKIHIIDKKAIKKRNKDEVIFWLLGNINRDDLQDLTDLFEFKDQKVKSKTKRG